MDENKFKVDRSSLSVTTLQKQDRNDINYWKNKSPHERLEALEITRQILYGYDPHTTRLQRFFEVVERS
jgi:hypothetical protein